jgi:GNAT superfamily N-acetyltransferase
MLDVDHHNKESLFAVAEEEIVGHAMYVKLADSSDAEVAFVVKDEWQSKGIGKLLLTEIAEKLSSGASSPLAAKYLERTAGCSACSTPRSPESHT